MNFAYRALALTTVLTMSALAQAQTTQPGPVAMFGGDRAGNGGSYIEMKVVNTAYRSLELMQRLERAGKMPVQVDLFKLETKLKYITVRVANDLELEGYRKSMVNYPAQNLVLISEPQFQKFQNDETQLLQLVTHEILPLVDVADKSYQNSSAIMREAGQLTTTTTTSDTTPQVLYAEEDGADQTGLSWESANRICGLQKQIFGLDYYFVYCVYIEKTKETVVPYVYDDSSYTSVWDEYSHSYRTYSNTQHVETQHIIRESVYGLRVFGVGKTSELAWKTLFSSLNLYDGSLSLTFGTEREAYRACRDILRSQDPADSFRYYQAKCRTPITNDGRYYYEILTQNPYVTGLTK